jgi:integrase
MSLLSGRHRRELLLGPDSGEITICVFIRLFCKKKAKRSVRPDDDALSFADYGTHSMRRTKATLIYRRTKNLRAVQLLLGHSKLESTVRYLGIEVDDALEISEQTEI